MAKSSNQKLKLLRLYSILFNKSDENHPLTTAELITELERYDISAERKSIYSDIEELTFFGLDIVKTGGKKNLSYYVGSRDFELAELKLLVDAVQSSKFISESKSNKLIKKISHLCSVYDASALNRYVYVANRPKTINENVLYNIDAIHNSLIENKKIKFQYYEWDINKKLVVKRDGDDYEICPKALIWDDENYYLVGLDCRNEITKHFRVDKMKNIVILDDRFEAFVDDINPSQYSGKMFGMFNGNLQNVNVRCPISKVGIFIDRFGKDISIRSENSEYCIIRIEVAVSNQFFGWITGLGKEFSIVGPKDVKGEYISFIHDIINKYDIEEKI